MVKMTSRVRPNGKLLPMLPLALHMGPSGGVLRMSGHLLGTSPGCNISEWVGAYSLTKRKPY